MTPDQIALVQGSFARIDPISDRIARHFYDDLFAASPELTPMFANTDIDAQGTKLFVTLAILVNGLYTPEKVMPVARALARSHVDYGVQPADYAKVGAALLRALQHGLGDAFTPEIRAAWSDLYTQVSAEMIAAAYPAQAAE